MKQSNLILKKLIASIFLIAGLGLLLFTQLFNDPANGVGRSESTTGSNSKSEGVRREMMSKTDQLNRRNPNSLRLRKEDSMGNDEKNRKALIEFIARMSDEDRQAKPEGYTMEDWAYFVAGHYQQVEQNGDIEFYAKVVDEHGNPLPNVRIQACVPSYEASLPKVLTMNGAMNRKYFDVITDERGLFRIQKEYGVKLILGDFKLSSYRLGQGSSLSFNFAPDEAEAALGDRHHADPADPVIFRMVEEELKPGYRVDDFE